VRRVLAWLASHSVSHAVLNLHHLPETISTAVGDGSDLGVSVRYSWEQPHVLGSAGGPRLALPLIGAERFFLINGDTLTDVDLVALLHAHTASNALVTLAVTPNLDPVRYGGVRLDSNGHVTGVARRGPEAASSYHFVGVQVAEAEAFQSLQPGAFANSVGDLYARLISERPGSIGAFVSRPSFHDIGTVEDYLATSRLLAATSPTESTATIHPSARIIDSILWDNVDIGARSVVERCIVTDAVRIPDDSVFEDVILVAGPTGLQTFPMPASAIGGARTST
jgi:NDP-sugar pyrophosphorylase family protein